VVNKIAAAIAEARVADSAKRPCFAGGRVFFALHFCFFFLERFPVELLSEQSLAATRCDSTMAIDTTGKWWKAKTPKDALEYLRSIEPGGYTVDEVLTQRCECGSSSFRLYCSRDDELSYLVCGACKAKTFN
jgi:hypothetical protein